MFKATTVNATSEKLIFHTFPTLILSQSLRFIVCDVSLTSNAYQLMIANV